MEVKEERSCPWCGETMIPEVKHSKNDYGDIVERSCSKCGKVLAAYLEQARDFLMKMRSF